MPKYFAFSNLEKNYRIALEFSAELFSRNIENEDEKSKIKESKLNEFLQINIEDKLNEFDIKEKYLKIEAKICLILLLLQNGV